MAGVKKPNPLIFEYAITEANANKSNSIMIGDCIEADVNGALNFGMDAILFNIDTSKSYVTIKQVSHLLELKKHL
jgi:putative hydrolase of the HAD superfamily